MQRGALADAGTVTTMANRILLGSGNHQFGIVGIENTFGTVTKVSLTNKADEYVFEDNFGDAAAVLLHNETIEMEIECIYDSTKSTPAIGTQVDFPIGSIKGNIVSIKYDRGNKEGRKLSFTAKHWKSLGNVTPTTLS